MAAYTLGLWRDSLRHLRADCLYTRISSGPNARQRFWENFTFLPRDAMLSAVYRFVMCRRHVSVCVSICVSVYHTPALYQNG